MNLGLSHAAALITSHWKQQCCSMSLHPVPPRQELFRSEVILERHLVQTLLKAGTFKDVSN